MPVNFVALILPALILPVTANEVNSPTEVMLPWAAVVTVPAVPAVKDAAVPVNVLVPASIVLFDNVWVLSAVNILLGVMISDKFAMFFL